MRAKDPRNIFIADDSPFFRITLGEMLAEAGHRVRFAKNGKEAIDEIKKDPGGIDLLILDLQMPEIDGFGVLKWIDENGYRGKFQILTITSIYEPTHVMGSVKNLGAVGFIQKDLPPDQILFKINKVLASDEKGLEWIGKGRIPVYLPVLFTVKEAKYTGHLINVSEGGALLRTRTGLSEVDNITLEFFLDDRKDRFLTMEGKARWQTHTMQNEVRMYWYGIIFSSMSGEDKKILKNFVDTETKKLGLGGGQARTPR